jgi:hypothetical protein
VPVAPGVHHFIHAAQMVAVLMAYDRVIQPIRWLDTRFEVWDDVVRPLARVASVHQHRRAIRALHEDRAPPPDVDVVDLQVLRSNGRARKNTRETRACASVTPQNALADQRKSSRRMAKICARSHRTRRTASYLPCERQGRLAGSFGDVERVACLFLECGEPGRGDDNAYAVERRAVIDPDR